MTTSLEQTDSPKLRKRPFSQPIDQGKTTYLYVFLYIMCI